MQKFLTKEKYTKLKALLEKAELNDMKSKADQIKVVLLANHGHLCRDIANVLFLDLNTVMTYLNDYCKRYNLSV